MSTHTARWRKEWVAHSLWPQTGVAERHLTKLHRLYMKFLFSKKGRKSIATPDFWTYFEAVAKKANIGPARRTK